MRITLVTGPFLPVPPLLGGAVERLMQEIAEGLAARGHGVTLISRQYSGLPDDEAAGGVRYRRVRGADRPRSLGTALVLDAGYALRVLRTLPPADLLVTNSFTLPILVRGHRHGRLCVNVERYPKGQLRLYRHAYRFISCSHAIKRAIVNEAPGLADKVSVIPNPLPRAHTAFVERSSQPFNEREALLLYVGRVHREKGLDILIRAFVRLLEDPRKSWRLAIVGPFQTREGGSGKAYLEELRRLAAEVADRVSFEGPQFDYAKLLRWYGRARLFVYPSVAEKGEALGVAPLEAMAAGCCTVVSALECFQDYIEHGRTGLVFDHRAPDPAATLVSVLESAMHETNTAAEIAEQGRIAGRAFHLDVVVRQYEALLTRDEA
jgi:glycosyltransferase involved in cell wall biosynthesis